MNKFEQRFRQRIADQGGEVLGRYVDKETPIDCLCPAKHPCSPRPYSIRRGHGMCRKCGCKSKKSSLRDRAKEKFHAAIANLNGKVVGEYHNYYEGVDCICVNQHPCKPSWQSIRSGYGICKTCLGVDPKVAEARFRQRVTELGGEVLGTYSNNITPVKCRCKNGHDCSPRPNGVNAGQGMCLTCSKINSVIAEANFRQRISELGGEVLGDYSDGHTPVKCRCKNGHDCAPRPRGVSSGQGMCLTCSGQDPRVAEANFRQRVAELGGEVLGDYTNNHTGIKCKCSKGHFCNPIPSNIQRGGGMCGTCKNKTEEQLNDWLKQYFQNVFPQYKFDWCTNNKNNRSLPFDFVVNVSPEPENYQKWVIIEVDGPQHFKQVSNWKSADITRQRDVYKAFQALRNGFAVVRIQQEDIFHNKIDWVNSLLQAFNQLQSGQIIYIGDETVYGKHYQDLQLCLDKGVACFDLEEEYDE